MPSRISNAHVLARLLIALIVMVVFAPCAHVEAAPIAPAVNGRGFSSVTSSSVLIYTNVYAHGIATNYYFQYGTTDTYGSQTSLASAGNGTVPIRVSQLVAGLALALPTTSGSSRATPLAA